MEELVSSKDVGFDIYWKYFKFGSSLWSLALFLLACVLTQALMVFASFWLKIWTNAEERAAAVVTNNDDVTSGIGNGTMSSRKNETGPWWEEPDRGTGVLVFLVASGAVVVAAAVRSVHFFHLSLSSSLHLHNAMFASVLRAPMHFFDRNPLGKYFLKCKQTHCYRFYIIQIV